MPGARAARLALVALAGLVAFAAAAPALAQPAAAPPRTAGPLALNDCLVDADLRQAALAALAGGAALEAVLARTREAIGDTRTRTRAERIVHEAARAQPADAAAYVSDRLVRCVAEARAPDVAERAAAGCYRLTRVVGDLAAARAAGVPLADAQAAAAAEARRQGLGEAGAVRFARLAETVYRASEPAPALRAALFERCIAGP